MRDILNENNKYQVKHQESIKYFGHNLFSSSNNLKKKKETPVLVLYIRVLLYKFQSNGPF